MKLVDNFIKTVADDLDKLNGAEFENLCCPLMKILTGHEYELKGHSLELKAVRGSVDFVQDEDFKTIGQCGTDSNYFTSEKPVNDIDSSKVNSPDFKTIYLFCNRRAKGDDFQATKKKIEKKLSTIGKGYHYKLFDGQRIARKIYANIYQTREIEKILTYLPNARATYYLLPQSNHLPLMSEDYKPRPEEEEVEKQLEQVDFVQVYGLSGIGKSQLSLAVANNINGKFETIFWFDGDKTDVRDLRNVSIRRMGEEINLATALEKYRTLVLVDNLNENVEDLFKNFSHYNKKQSKCIVTSLQKNVANQNCYNLAFVSDEISREILLDGDILPTEAQISQLLKKIPGYPLLLELAKKAVDNEEMTWDEVIEEGNLSEITDPNRNELFAQRILGRYVDNLRSQFNLLLFLGNTTVCKQFLRDFNRLRYNDLITFSIIQEAEETYCKVHQVVLSAVRSLIDGSYNEDEVKDYLSDYLMKHTEKRDAGLYTLMACHQQKLCVFGSTLPPIDLLRHYLTLAYLYTVDTYTNSDGYLAQINALKLDVENQKVDVRLLIERIEIEQNQVKKQFGESSPELRKKVESDIKLAKRLQLKAEEDKALINHHIGKWLSYSGDMTGAESYLLEALCLDPKSYHSMLRLAKNYKVLEQYDKAKEQIDHILELAKEGDVPLSIQLSAYDMISPYEYKDLKKKHIFDQLDVFTKAIYASLSENYSHTFILLAKYAEHLSYNYPEMFQTLCARLPLPLHIEDDERLRKDYGTIKAAQYLYGNYSDEYEEKLFGIAEDYLTRVSRGKKDGDYIRKTLIKLYLKAEKPKKALPLADEMTDKENLFNQQTLCKVYYGNEDYPKALEYIEKAIAQENTKQPEYCAALRHDKARCLYKLGDTNAKEVLVEAIKLQPNPKIKKEWEEELNNW